MRAIQLVDEYNFAGFKWPENTAIQQNWLSPFMLNPTERLISNIITEVKILIINNTVMPVTINYEEFDNSYVCSIYTTYIFYAKDELTKIKNPILVSAIKVLISLLGLLLKIGKINRVVSCNNWMLSTNLYEAVDSKSISEATLLLTSMYPKHSILFRSLNYYHNAELINAFISNYYLLVPSRQVYIFDKQRIDFMKCKNVILDMKLLNNSAYTIVAHDDITSDDYSRIIQLYEDLYLKKYSYHNPQFTEAFIRMCNQKKLMTMYGLRDEHGILQGIVGYFTRNEIMTTPLVGYNTNLPQKHGLYRMLIALVLRDSYQTGIVLNLSAGASQFKRLRGGFPEIEYSAIYISHLSYYRQSLIRIIRFFSITIGVPLMKKFKL